MRRSIRILNKVRRNGIRINLIIIFAFFALSCAPSSTVQEQVTPSPEITKETNTPTVIPTSERSKESKIPSTEIDSRMTKLVDFVPLAGIAIGIQFKGEIYEQGYGLANVENGKPATMQTKFKIASLTKSFTAAAILHLSEEGKLSLDDSITRFLPRATEVAKDVWVRHLLNHTSGLPDMSIDTAQASLPETFTTVQAVDYYFSTVQKLEFQPGEAWSYNNVGYFLLGTIIESVSGMTYDQYLKATFFEPGGLCSSSGDLLKWLDALARGKAIQPETWEQMITPTKLSDGQVVEYGFGLVIEEGSQGLEISHDGATAGFNSFFAYYPEHELSIVLLTNTDGFDPPLRGIASSLASDLLRE